VRVLVTGQAGFIGRHLERALREVRFSVFPIDIAYSAQSAYWSPYHPLDIRDVEVMGSVVGELKESGPWDACVHLAAIAAPDACKRDPGLAFDTNVRGTHNVLRLCERAGIKRVVFMSSAHTYGVSPKYMPTDESAPLALHDTYTTTKILGEELCSLFWKNHRISYAALRLFNAYGPGQSDAFFLGVKLAQAKAGGPVTLRNGEVTKDWVHVSDVVRAILRALESDFVGAVNIGTGIETSLEVLARQISERFGVALVSEPSDGIGPSRMRAEISRAKRVLGWEPVIEVKDGIDALIDDTDETLHRLTPRTAKRTP